MEIMTIEQNGAGFNYDAEITKRPWILGQRLEDEDEMWLKHTEMLMDKYQLDTFPSPKIWEAEGLKTMHSNIATDCGIILFCELWNIPHKSQAPKNPKQKEPSKTRTVKSRKVQCIETGVVYKSASEACRELKLVQSCLNYVLNGKRKSTNGMTFRYCTEESK